MSDDFLSREEAAAAAANGERGRDTRAYLTGFALAVLLTVPPFVLAWTGVLPRGTTPWVIAVAALVQIVVHLRYFLHVDLSRQKREDLQLILFTVLLLALMGGGTIWILSDLAYRMH
ncbi:cytochrome o ubiquinol oxidase subunit IV [Acuticoccus sediminis]|uniref:cytochrome o ubiquinol oxidase subunit IV n=1 Tax=Acuticoccus sediminis TaxID=2184697 RepID=UPI001CFE29AC|nr:cytochrome o ubiquinol oxidase subunit IV [Acuticoccus sediminis]